MFCNLVIPLLLGSRVPSASELFETLKSKVLVMKEYRIKESFKVCTYH